MIPGLLLIIIHLVIAITAITTETSIATIINVDYSNWWVTLSFGDVRFGIKLELVELIAQKDSL